MKSNLDILLEYIYNPRREYFRQKALGTSVGGKDADVESNDGQINVSCEEKLDQISHKDVHNLLLTNIKPEDRELIFKTMNRNPKLHTLQVAKPTENTVKIRIDDNELEAWMNDGGLATLMEILKNSGNYPQDVLNDLPGRISNVMTSREERKKMLSNSYNSVIQMWQHYLSTINDPETVELLKTYARIFQKDKIYGLVLSLLNVALIRSVNNNATFILPESDWLRKFNRRVKPHAQKYVVRRPLNDKQQVDPTTLKDVMNEMGWGDMAFSDLETQPQKAVRVHALKRSYVPKFYTTTIEYDISDTELIKDKNGIPKPDIFNNTIGLANNLTGQLNSIAVADKGEKNRPVEQDEVMVKRTELAADAMKEICVKNGIKVHYINPNNSSSVLADSLYAYYLSKAETAANLDKDTNKEQFARNAAHFTLIFTHLAWDKLSQYTHPVVYTKKECAEFLNVVNNLLHVLEPLIALNENNGAAYSREQLISAFKKFCADNKITITN